MESFQDSINAPLVLWLNGGLGCSSMIGWFAEIGPAVFENWDEYLSLNNYTWHKLANILYIESPGNVGFSYIDSYAPTETYIDDEITAKGSLYVKSIINNKKVYNYNLSYKMSTFLIPTCPKCKRIPLYKIHSVTEIAIQCECSYHSIISIENFLKERETSLCESNDKTFGDKYNMNCGKFLFAKCANIESIEPSLLDNIVKFNKNCFYHRDKEINGYCLSCKKHLCEECITEHLNKKHQIEYMSFLLEEIEQLNEFQKIEDIQNYLQRYLINIKEIVAEKIDEMIRVYEDKKKELMSMYEKSIKINQNQFEFIKIMYSISDKFKNYQNYNVIKNMLNCRTNQDTFWSSLYDHSDYINYYNISMEKILESEYTFLEKTYLIPKGIVEYTKIDIVDTPSYVEQIVQLSEKEFAICTSKEIKIYSDPPGYRPVQTIPGNNLRKFPNEDNLFFYIHNKNLEEATFNKQIKNFVIKSINVLTPKLNDIIPLYDGSICTSYLNQIRIWKKKKAYSASKALKASNTNNEVYNKLLELKNKNIMAYSKQSNVFVFWKESSNKLEPYEVDFIFTKIKDEMICCDEIDNNKMLLGGMFGLVLLDLKSYTIDTFLDGIDFRITSMLKIDNTKYIFGNTLGTLFKYDISTWKCLQEKKMKNYENSYISYLIKIDEILIFSTDRTVHYCKDY